MNILVVEDERNLADAIVRIVSDAGFNCEAVYDGNAGLTSAEISEEHKNAISHRGNALRAFREEWERRYGTDQ